MQAKAETYEFQSTRPLRGATVGRRLTKIYIAGFQSTRPLRGATSFSAGARNFGTHFNPRAPCGARHDDLNGGYIVLVISIHAPLAGRDVEPLFGS